MLDLDNLGWHSSQFLEEIQSVLRNELEARAYEMFKNGDFPPVNEREQNLINEENFAHAVMEYRRRTGCSVCLAKNVIDSYRK